MADPFIGEIRAFGFTYPPQGWVLCNGNTYYVNQYTALFAVIGNYYGGDGQNTFKVPNLQCLAPLGLGTGIGLTPHNTVGVTSGTPAVPLSISQFPPHAHSWNISALNVPGGQTSVPGPTVLSARENTAAFSFYGYPMSTPATLVPMNNAVVTPVGTQTVPAHENCQPFLPLSFCIAIEGIFPVRPN